MAYRFITSLALALLLCVSAGASILDAQNLGSMTIPSFTGNTTSPELPIAKGRADVSTLTCASTASVSSSPCNDATYASDLCVSGICACLTWSCSERNAFAGNGTATVEIGIDVDNGAALAPPDCYPISGQFTTASADAETTAFNGAVCDPVIAKSTTAPLTGGWQLIGWNTTKITDGAGGSFTGTLSLATGELKMTLKGRTF
ncbi:MAG TPA: hypothetical protein VKV03_00535 [Candidatus Binataceae bacterium]|nr:hypothetical protein [Candidatus Binataceae bacterium]